MIIIIYHTIGIQDIIILLLSKTGEELFRMGNCLKELTKGEMSGGGGGECPDKNRPLPMFT